MGGVQLFSQTANVVLVKFMRFAALLPAIKLLLSVNIKYKREGWGTSMKGNVLLSDWESLSSH